MFTKRTGHHTKRLCNKNNDNKMKKSSINNLGILENRITRGLAKNRSANKF
jgi:hypothetical protein